MIDYFVPEVTGLISAEMRKALTERRELIQQRAVAVLDQTLSERQERAIALGDTPTKVKSEVA